MVVKYIDCTFASNQKEEEQLIFIMYDKRFLINIFRANKEQIMQLQMNNDVILQKLTEMHEHKKGEIVMWKERVEKNLGTSWRPEYVYDDEIHSAVLVEVTPSIKNDNVNYDYKFRLLNENGKLSRLKVNPPKGFIWTHNIHKNFKMQ